MPKRDTPPLRPRIDSPRGILRPAPPGPGAFRHARYHASPTLERYVEHFWVVEWDLRGQPPERAETLPHPAVHLVFEAGRGGLLAGPTRAKFVRRLAGKGGAFAVKFRPGGFRPFARGPVSRLADRQVPIGEEYVGVGPKWVIQRYRLLEAAVRLASGEAVAHAALALELGYGDQAHFVRDFKAIVGTSPAAYARARVPVGRRPPRRPSARAQAPNGLKLSPASAHPE